MNQALFAETYQQFKKYKISYARAEQAAIIVALGNLERSWQEQKIIRKVWRKIRRTRP